MRVEENLISADMAMKPASMADLRKLTVFVDSGFSFNQVPKYVPIFDSQHSFDGS